MCAYGGVFAYAVEREHERLAAPATIALGGIGALMLLGVLHRAEVELLVWPLGLLAAAYGVAIAVHGSGVDEGAPLVAVGLFLCGELAAWSLDERFAIPAERAVVLGRATALGLLALAGLGAAALVVALAATSAGGGLAWTTVGAAAAVGVVALGVALARRAEAGG